MAQRRADVCLSAFAFAGVQTAFSRRFNRNRDGGFVLFDGAAFFALKKQICRALILNLICFHHGDKRQIAVAFGGVQTIADEKFIRHDETAIIN